MDKTKASRKMETYVINPETDRPIKVGGPTYDELKEKGKRVDQLKRHRRPARQSPTPTKVQPDLRRKRMQMDVAKQRSLEKELENLRPSQKAKRRDLKKAMKHKGEGRGSPTRGWGAAAPQRGKERNKMMKECGPKCFLRPDDKGFPICAKDSCDIDCRGVQAAYNRARQWGYSNIASEADNLREAKCDGKKKAQKKKAEKSQKTSPKKKSGSRSPSRSSQKT